MLTSAQCSNPIATSVAASRGIAAFAKTTPEPTDETLITRIASGLRPAMQTLYARHKVRIYRFVLRLTGDPALAEDIVSDVFLEVWRQADRFHAKSQVTTWLLAIARNKAISVIRRRTEDALDEELAANIVDPTDDAQTLIENADRSVIIRKCLTQLSAEHREVLDLVYYHERTVEEVAKIVDAPINTVKTRMFYARKHLGKLLRAKGIESN